MDLMDRLLTSCLLTTKRSSVWISLSCPPSLLFLSLSPLNIGRFLCQRNQMELPDCCWTSKSVNIESINTLSRESGPYIQMQESSLGRQICWAIKSQDLTAHLLGMLVFFSGTCRSRIKREVWSMSVWLWLITCLSQQDQTELLANLL